MTRHSTSLLLALLVGFASAFQISPGLRRDLNRKVALRSSFAADGSEYSSNDSSDMDDDDSTAANYDRSYRDEQDDTPTVELQPVPMSKNSGNRFVAFLWDQEIDTEARDVMDLHNARVELTEDHVMFCRKANLYNETFNSESMVDVVWSLPM